MNMDKSELQDYNNWVGKSAQDVRRFVDRIPGGWLTIFPHSLPLEIHIVRNYFNVLPKKLELLTKQQARPALERVKYFEKYTELVESVVGVHRKGIISDKALMSVASLAPGMGSLPRISKPSAILSRDASKLLRMDKKATFALTGVVFQDQQGLPWYLMSPVGATFHINKGQGNKLDLAQAILDIDMPFKLVSPDGKSGGSHEVIIKPGKFEPGKSFIPVTDFDPATRGSYNYGETITSGSTHHERLDVVTHQKFPHYHNVNNSIAPNTLLQLRKFMPPVQLYGV